jgi:hypothetical protein
VPSRTETILVETLPGYAVEIEDETGHPAHFSLLSSANTVFSKEVVMTGDLMVCRDLYHCRMFTMHTLSMYLDLNLERKEILEQYTA